MISYDSFLNSPAKRQWEKIGARRRAGVSAPLFSLYSSRSLGIGEIPDLKLLADWCQATGMSLIQLLPMNEVGFNFTPYDAQSSFALEPMYLRLDELVSVNPALFASEADQLRNVFATGSGWVDYKIKKAKLELLGKIFEKKLREKEGEFQEFVRQNAFWIEDYVLFRVLKEENREMPWWEWPAKFKERSKEAIEELKKKKAARLEFYAWLQFQLFLQFRSVKAYAAERGVFLVGDIPFLVSKDSADVWAHQDYFKLGLAAGAPPDAYSAKGQRWGMPPYHWENLARQNYDYWRERLRYAENFYDLFRIDHFVGIFRIWTVPLTEPLESGALHGKFDPPEEGVWEERGRRIVSMMLESTGMLPCAEDLGVVPDCSYRVLEEFALPGMDVQRWLRDWGKSYEFKPVETYRKNSIAVVSTHDMSIVRGWWEVEAGSVDEAAFRMECQKKGVPFDSLREKLFDPKNSHYGRLRWREEIASEDRLLEILNLKREEAWAFLDWYRGSYSEKGKFCQYLGLREKGGVSPCELARRTLEKIHESASIFSIQLLSDWISTDESVPLDPWNFRINFPGANGKRNWRLVFPLSLEALNGWRHNAWVKELNLKTGRA